MKDYNKYVTLEIKLPRHIAEWLKKFSEELAKTPDQVLVYILTYYYEAWRIGYEAGLKSSTTVHEKTQQTSSSTYADSTLNNINNILDNILNEYIAKSKHKAKFKWIIRKFVSWVLERPYHLDLEELKSAVKEFIDEYKKNRKVSKNTLYTYKMVLNDFIKYVCLQLKQKSVKDQDRQQG